MMALLTKTISVILLGFFLWGSSAAWAASDDISQDVTVSPDPASGPVSSVAEKIIVFFQHYISGIDGDRCPMYPTCSQYSLDALQKHGLLMGWVMCCDRLLRCGRDELTISPVVIIDGDRRCYDPVENNDFWWAR